MTNLIDDREFFNVELYNKILEKRSLQKYKEELTIFENFKVNHEIKYKDKIYLIEKIYRVWCNGYYITLLLNNNGSHFYTSAQNISSRNKDVIYEVESFNIHFQQL